VHVFCVAGIDRLQGDALQAYDAMVACGVLTQNRVPEVAQLQGVVVDALLGTGLDRPVSAAYASAVDAVNTSGLPVLALDIPSGLHADTGVVLGRAVVANVTVSFIGLKQGLFTADGPDCCGELEFSDLGVPASIFDALAPDAYVVDRAELLRWLPPRRRNVHKGHFGHVLVVGGDYGFAGAVRMSAEAAARTGAGLVSLATRTGHAHVIGMSMPEVMCHGVDSTQDLIPLLSRASVVAVGPGLGQSPWAEALFNLILAADKPLVVDADALSMLSRAPCRNKQWILTPHPGEAARLLGVENAAVQNNRFAAVVDLQSRYDGVCILKGCGTLIKAPTTCPQVCCEGNPGMASGGMGDVLTGVIAGLLAQQIPLGPAAALGVALHAAAADRVALAGTRGMLARDVISALPAQINPVFQPISSGP
jgi:NAD(P)H-hydrate epimerase